MFGGATAQFDDLGTESIDKLPLVLTVVLSLTFFYLLVIFRSLLIPAKAVLMNLLATAAAFGLTVWVFQQGHLEDLLGFTSVGFVQVYLPITVFAVLFGLSMDYEVFLIRRMQEEWLATHDNDQAVVTGIAHTARPIVAAAAIMAAVFGCFLVADVLVGVVGRDHRHRLQPQDRSGAGSGLGRRQLRTEAVADRSQHELAGDGPQHRAASATKS